MKNIILFRFAGSNKECLRNVSTMMETDNVLVYKSKQTGNWYQWEKRSTGRPIALSDNERDALLNPSMSKIINWGNHILHDQSNIICNKPSACKISSNKWHTRKIWQENNIKTPKSSDRWEDMIDFPFIARPWHHARQSEFNAITNFSELSQMIEKINVVDERNGDEWYFQKIVPKTCEFRVYVTGDKVATIFWKGNGDQLLSSNQEWHWLDDVNWNPDKLPPRSFPNNYQNFIEFKEDIQKIKEECIRATKVLGLDYSGIDVGLDTNAVATGNEGSVRTREFNLFESNTDPELTQLPQRKFAKYFDQVFQQ